MWLELIISAIVAALIFYRWATYKNDYFKKRNISYDKPTFLLGTGVEVLTGKKTIVELFCELHSKTEDLVYGIFEGRQPVYLVRDPQLVHHVMIKDFDHFVNRRTIADLDDNGNIFTKSLFFMQNEKWRDMRHTLSPAFTGSKMRQMFKLIQDEIDVSMKYLKEQIQETKSEVKGLEVDVKDFTSRLTVNVIATTAFGLQVNSFKNREDEFYNKARASINFTGLQQLKALFMQLFPKVALYFKLDVFDKDYIKYFNHLVLDAMKYRLEHNIQRPDMINLLMEARGVIPTDTPKTHYRQWSDTDVVAQCFLFFIAGMEPSAGVMSFSVHELMEHPEVQQKLYEEILEVSENLEYDSVTYDILQKMSYMDKVVSEMMRKWPVALVTDRECNKDYVFESNGKRLEIKKGELLRIPMIALHRDPKYYPQPDVIDPERFSEERKSQIENGAYLPFGLGPRNCIANRFAIMEVKAFLFHLVKEYRLEASPKTMRPMVLKKSAAVQLVPENGFWIQFVPRK